MLVGPNLPDAEFLAIDTVRYVVDFAALPAGGSGKPRSERTQQKTAEPEQQEMSVNVGTLTVASALYLCWIYCCRTYTIRGRVVCRQWSYDPRRHLWFFCDNPVPGAKVYIYDVNCFFIWCSRRLIGTATTDINGNFVFTFRWCCFRWYPWLDTNWVIDENIYRRVSEVLTAANLPVPPVPPGPGPDPAIFNALLDRAPSLNDFSRRALTASEAGNPARLDNSLSREALLSVLPASPELEALHVWPWWPWNDCDPDIVFEATQFCRDRFEVIYSETNSQARWNIPTTLNATLIANEKACCLPRCHEPACPDCLVFSWICNGIPTDKIGNAAGPADLRGYAYTDVSADLPFTRSLQIRGDLGSGIDYYKVQYRYNGGAWTDLPVPAFQGFPISYFVPFHFVAVPPPGFTPVLKDGQTVIISRQHYALLNGTPTFGGQVDWNDFDTLFYFDTLAPGILDGLYELQLVGYTADAGDHLTNERAVPICGGVSPETLFIRVDNRHSIHPPSTPTHPCGGSSNHICTLEPDCYIRSICMNEGRSDMVCISACDIIHMKQDDTLTIHFSVTCPPNANDGHLGGYKLEAEYGVSQLLTLGTAPAMSPCPTLLTAPRGTFEADPTIQIGPTYLEALAQGATRPHWFGGDYKVTLRGCDFPESCAYDFRLCAWKRTTTGCTTSACDNLDYNRFEITLTILLS